MKYFLDTEFIESPCTIELISIGIVCEDGRGFYAVSNEYNPDNANQWVRINVLSYVKNEPRISIEHIKSEILCFVGEDKSPKFYGYYCAYDWVVFCWIFGRMIDLPSGWPMYCRDIKQMADERNIKLPISSKKEHHALADARWNMKAFYTFHND